MIRCGLVFTGLIAIILAGPVVAATLTIENGVANYASLVKDAAMRSDGEAAAGVPWVESNIGTSTTLGSHRMYPDVGYPNTRGPRRYIVWVDVSGIPAGSTINSATLSLYFQRNDGNAPAISNYKLSRLQPGRAWEEGAGQAPAVDGSVTWNSQVSYPVGDPRRVQWEAAGATGTTDVDQNSTIIFNKTAGNSEWKDFDVTSWVADWYAGTWTNTGVLLWGGEGPGGSLQSYWQIVGKETADSGNTNHPKLVVNYTPPGGCGSTVTPVAPQSVTGFAGGGAVPVARIDLGSPDVSYGMTHPICCDGMTVPTTIGGRSCRTNVNPANDTFMYFAVNDELIYDGNHPAVTISFDYYDEGTGAFGVNYDGAGSEWSDGLTVVPLTGTNTWKRGSITITDAKFANREHAGADFRIWRGMQVPFYLDNVTVSRSDFSVNYTVENVAAEPINWTVTEANADGTASDYPWLALSTTGGSLNATETAPVTASIDTSSLSAGTYAGYLRFDDGCATVNILTDAFAYAAGTLLDNDGWGPVAGINPANAADGTILVTADGAIQFFGNSTPDVATATNVTCDSGVVSVKIKAKAGTGSGHTLGSFMAQGGGQIMGWWMLQADKVSARDPVNNVVTELALGADYTELEMRINTATHQTEFWYGEPKVHLVTYPFAGSATTTVERVGFVRVANAEVTKPNEYLYLDDLSLSYIGAHYRLREIDLNVIGCFFDVTPRNVAAQGCANGSLTRTFTITNTGAYTIDSFTVAEVEPINGLPHEYPWLTLSDTAGLALTPGESAMITATVDMTLVPPPGEIASLQFMSYCGGTPVRDTLVNALAVSILDVGTPQTFVYEGDKMPADAGFRLLEGVDQGGSGVVDDPDARDGKAFHLPDINGAKSKYQMNAPNVDPARGITMVGRFKALTDEGSSYGGLYFWHPTLTCELHWGGPNGHLKEVNRGVETYISGDANYHRFRMTARNEGGSTGIVIRLYVDDVLVINMTNASAGSYGSTESSFGFGAGGTSSAQDLYYDRIAFTDAGAFAPGEEVSCLGCTLDECLLDCRPAYCLEPRGRVFADADGDLDVDMADFAMFQLCYTFGNTEGIPSTPAWCACLDHGDDDLDGEPQCNGQIDNYDLRAFLNCATGPSVPWSQELAPDCNP